MRLWGIVQRRATRSARLDEFGGKVVKNVNTTCDVQRGRD
jgi:hypothetical protein